MSSLHLSDRDLAKLRPDLRAAWDALRTQCLAEGIDIMITEGWRSPARQDWIYASGRTRPGPILTHAKRGQSDHNHTIDGTPASKAIDVCFVLDRNDIGRPVSVTWSGPWMRVAQIAKGLGLKWGGDWKHPKTDKPHFYVEDEADAPADRLP